MDFLLFHSNYIPNLWKFRQMYVNLLKQIKLLNSK